MNYKNRGSLRRLFMYTFLIIFGFFSFFPFYWMVLAATNYSVDVIKGANTFGKALLYNFNTLISKVDISSAFINSLKNSIIGTLASLFVCSLAGYGFQVYRDKNKDLLMKILLLSLMVPFATLMVPLFQMFSQFRLLDTTLGFILPFISTAFLIFFFRQNTMSFPYEIVQAARVDGLSELGIYFKIYFPIMIPTFASALIVTFMNNWNNYLWPLIILRTQESQTMPLLLVNMTAGYTTDYGALMLAVTICTLPTLLIFVIFQKYFISGILGAVK